MKNLTILCLTFFTFSAFAGPKQQFIDAVIKQCKVTEEEAKKEVTPGRAGTVTQFKVCAKKNITLTNGCILTCKKKGAGL